MDELFNTINGWLKEKTSSGLYFTFVLFYVSWNWKFFYFIFIEDSSLLNKPRIEYIEALNFHFSLTTINCVDLIISCLLNFSWHLMPPIFFTYLIVKYFSEIYNWSHDLAVKNNFKRKGNYDDELLKYERNKTVNLVNVKEEKVQQNIEKEKIEKTLSQKEKWDIEYLDFKMTSFFVKFPQISKTIYEDRGDIGYGANRSIDIDILSFATSSGIIIFNQDKNQISFTDKGNYFNVLYSKEKNN